MTLWVLPGSACVFGSQHARPEISIVYVLDIDSIVLEQKEQKSVTGGVLLLYLYPVVLNKVNPFGRTRLSA